MDLQLVLKYFNEISQVPRPSKKEGKIREYLINFANEKNLEYKVDEVGNVVIYVPETFTKMESKPLILQSHMDMVCVKSEGISHDFDNDPITIIENNGFLQADQTTLGADNGVGIAFMLASVSTPIHPRLELLFTVDEEKGLNGALNLDASMLSGKLLLNLDTEDEGEVCISSAGGTRLDATKSVTRMDANFEQYSLSIYGLQGGHSGVEIHKNRGNAIYLLVDFLKNYDGGIELVSIDGGTAENVIPSSVKSFLGIADIQDFDNKLQQYLEFYRQNYDCPDLNYDLVQINQSYQVINETSQILESIHNIKVGVYSMNDKINGLVNTSNNIGIIQTNEDSIFVSYMPRSSIGIELDDLIESMENNYKMSGFDVNVSTKYYGWQQDPDSDYVRFVYNVMQNHFPQKTKLVAYHAGLECGIIVDKIGQGAQAVSVGPTIIGAHSVDEKVSIKSIENMCGFLNDLFRQF